MSNNCLVTKLKGTVQNDNLPLYNTLFADWVGYTSSEDPSNNKVTSLCIGVSSDSPNNVVVKSKANFHMDTIAGSTLNEVMLVPGEKRVLVFIYNEIGTAPISELVCITGVYGTYEIASYSGTNDSGLLEFKDTAKNRINDYLECCPINVFGSYIPAEGSTVNVNYPLDNIKFLSLNIDNPDTIEGRNRRVIFNSPISPNIEVIQTYPSVNAYHPVIRVSDIKNTNIKVLTGNERLDGTVADLPSTLMALKAGAFNTSLLTGDLIDFVTNARAKGRTSGHLVIATGTIKSSVVTYQGTSIKDLIATLPVVADPNVGGGNCWVLEWTPNSVSWSDTFPYTGRTLSLTPYWYSEGCLDNIGG